MSLHLDSFFSLYAIKKIYLCMKEITMNDQTVICAIATAPGMGAIAVIRLSGKGCIEICDRIFVSTGGCSSEYNSFRKDRQQGGTD